MSDVQLTTGFLKYIGPTYVFLLRMTLRKLAVVLESIVFKINKEKGKNWIRVKITNTKADSPKALKLQTLNAAKIV